MFNTYTPRNRNQTTRIGIKFHNKKQTDLGPESRKASTTCITPSITKIQATCLETWIALPAKINAKYYQICSGFDIYLVKILSMNTCSDLRRMVKLTMSSQKVLETCFQIASVDLGRCFWGNMWDAPLTSKGQEQAADLKPLMSREHVDLVVSSLAQGCFDFKQVHVKAEFEENGLRLGTSWDQLFLYYALFHLWKQLLESVSRQILSELQPILRNGWKVRTFQAAICQGSPLTRAIETGLLASPPGHHVVTALASEHLEASCDIGRPQDCFNSNVAIRFLMIMKFKKVQGFALCSWIRPFYLVLSDFGELAKCHVSISYGN